MPLAKAAGKVTIYIFTKMVKKYPVLHLIVTEKEVKLLD